MEKTTQRIGLFGGSFNPLHNGHLDIAAAAQRQFGLQTVLFMVAKDPPHKQIAGHVDAAARFAMTVRGLEGRPGFTASDLELGLAGKSYTLFTVEALQARFPEAQICCVVGADMLLDLSNWYEPEKLLGAARFIGVGRATVEGDLSDAAAALRARYGAHIDLCDFTGPDISSTKVRERVYAAKPVEDMAPDGVNAFIYETGLYMPADFQRLQEKVRAALKKKRYLHTMGTVRCAVALADRYGVEGERARLAALLHDCAKFETEEQLRLCEAYGMDLSGLSRISKGILHGPLGAEYARREYGITDAAVLSAIACHTLCKEDMSPLDKVIYLADKIEPGRDYEGVEDIRAAARNSLDAGVLACMDHSIAYVEKEGKPLHPGILAARDFILGHTN